MNGKWGRAIEFVGSRRKCLYFSWDWKLNFKKKTVFLFINKLFFLSCSGPDVDPFFPLTPIQFVFDWISFSGNVFRVPNLISLISQYHTFDPTSHSISPLRNCYITVGQAEKGKKVVKILWETEETSFWDWPEKTLKV